MNIIRYHPNQDPLRLTNGWHPIAREKHLLNRLIETIYKTGGRFNSIFYADQRGGRSLQKNRLIPLISEKNEKGSQELVLATWR